MDLKIKNRGWGRVLEEIGNIMAELNKHEEIVELYAEYLDVTEGDKQAAATLVLATIRQQTEKVIAKVSEKTPQVGSFGTIDSGDK